MPAPRLIARSRRVSVWFYSLAGAGAMLWLLVVGMLLLPNSVHVGQDEYFYSCGTALFPITEPNEALGRAACSEVTSSRRLSAAVISVVGMALLGVLLVGAFVQRSREVERSN